MLVHNEKYVQNQGKCDHHSGLHWYELFHDSTPDGEKQSL